MLGLLGALTLLTFFPSHLLTTNVKIHVFVVVGLAPLMLGAMGHFIPVLTRTPPSKHDKRSSLLMLLAGSIAVTGFWLWFPLVYPAALIGITAAGDLLWNAYTRIRKCLGSPHPCVYWYTSALTVLIIALGSILVGATLPQHWSVFKAVHLHLNLLGFIPLTALGTLQVLLPTAGGFTEPTAAARLKSDLPWAIAGIVLIALGVTLWRPVGFGGMVIGIVLIARFLRALFPYRHTIFRWHGATISLLFATFGLVIVYGLAGWHLSVAQSGYTVLLTMLCLFLLPLLTGALTQLVPVWLDSSFSEEQRAPLRKHLGYGAALRVAGFWVGGVSYALGEVAGLWLAAATLLLFILQMVTAIAARRR